MTGHANVNGKRNTKSILKLREMKEKWEKVTSREDSKNPCIWIIPLKSYKLIPITSREQNNGPQTGEREEHRVEAGWSVRTKYKLDRRNKFLCAKCTLRQL